MMRKKCIFVLILLFIIFSFKCCLATEDVNSGTSENPTKTVDVTTNTGSGDQTSSGNQNSGEVKEPEKTVVEPESPSSQSTENPSGDNGGQSSIQTSAEVQPSSSYTSNDNTRTRRNTQSTSKTRNSDDTENEQKQDAKKDTVVPVLNSLKIFGISESGERTELKLNPDFNSQVFEYTVDVESNVKSVEIEKDAGEFEENTKINGNLELADGQNNINIVITNEDKTSTYNILINRKIIEENQEQTENLVRKEPKKHNLIGLVIAIIVLGVLVGLLIVKIRKTRG